MRFYEFQTSPTIKATKPIQATKPLNPQQARVASLKRNADNAKRVYKAEKNRQTVVKAQTQIFAATHPKKNSTQFSNPPQNLTPTSFNLMHYYSALNRGLCCYLRSK